MSINKDAMLRMAALIIDRARKNGATMCDVSIAKTRRASVKVRAGVLETESGALSLPVQLRVFVGQQVANLAFNLPSGGGSDDMGRVAAMVDRAVEMARVSQPDPLAGLPNQRDLAKSWPDLKLYDSRLAALTLRDRVELAAAAESAAMAVPGVSSSEGADFASAVRTSVYASSKGFMAHTTGTSCSLSVEVLAAEENDKLQEGNWVDEQCSLDKLMDPTALGKMAGTCAARMLGASKIASSRMPVVFESPMSSQLLEQFLGAAWGTAVAEKSSFLAGMKGQLVAAPGVTIIDEPHLPGAPGSSAFGSEGIRRMPRTIVNNGVLSSYLIDARGGRKLGVRPNGGGYTNVSLRPGVQTPEQIIAGIKRGLFLVGVSGQGFDSVTGDYSVGASGILIENGELTMPVEEITIAGNIKEMFAAIVAIGNDLPTENIAAPTMQIGEMTVSGK